MRGDELCKTLGNGCETERAKVQAVIHHQELWMLKVDCVFVCLQVSLYLIFAFQSSCTTELVLVMQWVLECKCGSWR
jgi:hypothetical protein